MRSWSVPAHGRSHRRSPHLAFVQAKLEEAKKEREAREAEWGRRYFSQNEKLTKAESELVRLVSVPRVGSLAFVAAAELGLRGGAEGRAPLEDSARRQPCLRGP